MCAAVQRASRMSRTSLSDAASLPAAAKVSETLVKYTTREKLGQRFAEVKDDNNITLFIISLNRLSEVPFFLALSRKCGLSSVISLIFFSSRKEAYPYRFCRVLRVRAGSQANETGREGTGDDGSGVVCAVQRRAVH